MSTQEDAQVVVLTALPLEYDAVRRHLHDRVARRHRVGTQFEVGSLTPGCRVALAELGPGNLGAALVASHAIEMFQPKAIMFVGIAGALQPDLQLGDVVVATKIYSFQGGMATDDDFLARPQAYDADWGLLQSARVVARARRAATGSIPVHFKPVAAGEVVLNSRTQPLAQQLKRNYNDAVAIEMESFGLARAGHMHHTPTLTVRGISDRADGAKQIVDAAGSQPIAAEHAADFATAVIADFLSEAQRSPAPKVAADSPEQPSVQIINAVAAPAYGAQHGNVIVHEFEPPASTDWRKVSRPPEVAWRSVITRQMRGFESSALELHLVPVTQAPHMEVRRLSHLADELATHLPARVAVETDIDDSGARATSTDRASGTAGLFLGRSGQRSAWEALPHDSIGPILDEAWLIERLTTSVTTLIRLSPPRAARYAPALAVTPANTLTVGRVDQLPRTKVSGFLLKEKLQVPPDESVPAEDLDHLAHEVASELAARLLMVFRQGNR